MRKVPVELMFRFNFVPLEELADGSLAIAMADPSQLMMIDEIGFLLHKRIRTKVATLSQISDILKKTEQSQRVLEEASEGFTLDVIPARTTPATRTSPSSGSPPPRATSRPSSGWWTPPSSPPCSGAPATFTSRPATTRCVIKYRIDGVLQQAMQPIAKEHHSTILSRIKVMSELDISERRVPQDGRFRVRYNGALHRFPRLHHALHPRRGRGAARARQGIDEREVPQAQPRRGRLRRGSRLRRFRRYISEPYGMVLVTGPTGSGKTTTLYAALNEIKTDEDKIITIEDPVEYQIRGITQIPVNEKKGLTFARGLRSILRHDPDKIMVGEIRDTETAQIAIQSALTGHLVFTTVHANNVVDVLGRFLNMGVEPYNFVSALNCILAQRLVRIICDSCKKPLRYPARRAGSQRPGPETLGRGAVLRRRGLHRVLRHRLPRAYRDHRVAGAERPHPRDDSGTQADLGDPPRRPRRRNAFPARIGS